MTLNKVDLPQPDGPITAKNSPGSTSKETWSRAMISPSVEAKHIARSSTTRIAGPASGAAITRSSVETLAIFGAIAGSAPGASHCSGHDGGIAGLDPHIDDGNLTGINRGNGFFKHRREIAGFGHRSESGGALGAAHGRE